MSELTLSSIVDEVNEKRLYDQPHCCGRRVELCGFVAKRQGQPGSYGGLFAPIDGEIAGGYRFFTGERINTNAGCRHILGEEALRALAIMEPRAKYGQQAIERASDWVGQRLHESETTHGGGLRERGTFCCHRCSVALWRTFVVAAIPESTDRLACGIKWLRTKRNGDGDWRGFPFYYTLSALLEADTEADIKEARAELRYAQPIVERRLKRAPQNSDDVYKQRRRRILELAAERG